jgi:peptide/nickel transport system permease protein
MKKNFQPIWANSTHRVWYIVKKSPLSLVGVLIIIVIMVFAIFAPWIAPYNPQKIDLSQAFRPPSVRHLCGTDDLGRDIFSRIVYGARISLEIAFTVVSIAAVVGTVLGLISGYFGGTVDMVIMRVVDAFLAMPSLLLAMVGVAALGPSVFNTMLALSLVFWTWYARIVRGEVLRLRNTPLMTSLHSMGAGASRILFRHLLPNCIGPIAVQSTLQLGYAVLTSAALSFLGLGAQPPTPAWGLMVSTGRKYLPDSWWMITFPGLMIFLLVMGFILLGDTIRDVVSRDIQ